MDEVLVQDTGGNRWLFSCNGQQQLYYQIKPGRREILLPDMSGEFDIITSANGHFHLAAQTIQGTLVYLCHDGETWRKYTILHSKSSQPSMTQLNLRYDGTRLHAFYILQHAGRHMLVHHAFGTDGSISAPHPVGYVHPARRYCAAADGKQTCHLYFFDEDCLLQYRQLRMSDGTCRLADPPVSGQIRAVSAVCDASGILHTAYVTQQKQYYTISYCRADGAPKLLSFGVDNIAALAVIAAEKQIAVQWQERYNVYECTSGDGGETFSKPRNLSATKGSGTKLIRVRLPANPWGLLVDRCACIGTAPLYSNLFPKPDARTQMPPQPQTAMPAHGRPSDTLTALQAQLSETQMEVVRLRQLVSQLLENQPTPAGHPPANPSLPGPAPEIKTDIDPDNVGEIDQENYQLFQQMTVEDLDFSAGQTF